MTRRIAAIVCPLAFVVGLFGCLRPNESQSNEEAQKELLTFLGGLESGMSPSSVEELFNRGQYRKLELSKSQEDSTNCMCPSRDVAGNKPHLAISTPIIWGAGNWIAYIEFERDVISAVRVRTADSVDDHPDAAPPDRTFRP